MSYDLAAKKPSPTAFTPVLEELALLVESLPAGDVFAEPARTPGFFKALCHSLPADLVAISAEEKILAGRDFESYGAHMAALFQKWDKAGGSPSLPAIMALAVRIFDLSVDEPTVRAAMIGALLGEIPNTLQYHGNLHYRKVLLHTIRLAAANNQIFAGTDQVIGKDRIALLLAAACVHDVGHEGGDNLRDGVYTPGYMEQRALDIVRPYMDAIGLPEEQRKDLETIVFCTDITFFAGDNSPCIRMKKIFRHVFWGDDVGDASLLMMGRLRRYEDDALLVRMAMLLHEADIVTSAGLSYEQTMHETINIMEEREMKIAGPKIVLNFLREQLGQNLYTEAARQIFGPNMAAIIRQAEADLAAGRQTFYE